MTFIVSVIYPNDNPSAKFDMDYYLATHMPLVAKSWGPHGLKEYRVNQFDATLGDGKPAYRVQAILYFNSGDDAKKALGADVSGEVFGDVPKFTDISPVLTMGDVKATEMV